MYAILIVDDEIMIREGIKLSIPWNTIDIDRVYTAASFEEARSVISENKIDILLTDINMPQQTGLDLIRQIRMENTEMKIIVLTGYDDFEYARASLRMEVADYLMKPIDEDVLLNAIHKQVGILNDNKKKLHLEAVNRRIQGTVEQERLEKIMHEMIYADKEPVEYMKELQDTYHFSATQKLQVVILLYELEMKNTEADDFELLTVKNICFGLIDAQNIGITFIDGKKIILVYLVDDCENETCEQLEQLQDILRDEYNRTPRIFAGSVVEGFKNIHISYNDARYLMSEERKSINDMLHLNQESSRADLFLKVYQQLKNIMNENIENREYMMKAFDTFEKATYSYCLTMESVRQCCIELIAGVYFSYLCSNSQENCDMKEALAKSSNEIMRRMTSCSKKEQLRLTRQFLENLGNSGVISSHEIISKSINYIENHLSEELSVAALASELCVTPNYFSRLFKRVMGEGCNEYIIKKRIERAQVLLATTNIKIAVIAEDVGYHDTNYFSLAFKKNTGKNPSQYREGNRS